MAKRKNRGKDFGFRNLVNEKLEKVKNAIDKNQEAILFCHDEWHMINNEKKNRLRYGPAGADLYKRLLFKDRNKDR